MSVWHNIYKRLNRKIVVYTLSLILIIALLPLALSPEKETRCAYGMILVAAFWLLEPAPIAVTALLPVILFPMLGVLNSSDVCQYYMKESFMMFIGGLIIAIAVEECRLHERIALKVLLLVGTDVKWLMMGFMLTTMLLSMWVSNTATTAMMVPIVDAVVGKICTTSEGEDIAMDEKGSLTESKVIDEKEDDRTSTASSNEEEKMQKPVSSKLKVVLLLSICYSANIGGTGTLTGTGPNLVLKGLLEELFPHSSEVTFATWMMYNIPGMVLCVLIAWLYLYLIYIRCSDITKGMESKDRIREIIFKRYKQLGPLTMHEAQVIFLFLVLVFLWVFRDPKFVVGWGTAMGPKYDIGDSVPAMAIAFLLFFLPSNLRDMNSPRILDWKTAQLKLPWAIILLTGGGFALANAAQKSGMSSVVGTKLASLDVLPAAAIVAITCLGTAMVTEVVSNSTTANILLPIISQLAISIGINPLALMIPLTVVCSYAFMLPVATAPNAIAFESGHMKTTDMAKPGIVMNILCCGVQLFMINTLGVVIFDLNTFPIWAQTESTNATLSTNPFNVTLPEIQLINMSLANTTVYI